MNLETLRTFCKQLPHVAEDVKWGNDLCFLIGGKMFAVTCLDRINPIKVSFKCTPEKFSELIEQDGIVPAPYMARNQWVSLERWDAMRDAEIKVLVQNSYELVKSKLTKKAQAELGTPTKPPGRASKKATSR
jgi:predicted DNA-binding protein (MmcQ/YjbR family)